MKLVNIEKLSVIAIVALTAAIVSFGGGPAYARGADFTLFTSEDTGTADDFVTCSCNSKCELHVLATNFDPDEDRINIVFLDGDSILFRVPQNDSRSFTQFIATVPQFDGAIDIDPLDQDGDVNPMVMYISLRGPGASCDVTTFNPIP